MFSYKKSHNFKNFTLPITEDNRNFCHVQLTDQNENKARQIAKSKSAISSWQIIRHHQKINEYRTRKYTAKHQKTNTRYRNERELNQRKKNETNLKFLQHIKYLMTSDFN